MLLSLAEYEQANFSHTFFQELMPTFTEFVETKPAKDEQVSNIEHYAVMLCDALYMDKKRQTLSYHQQAINCGGDDNAWHNSKIAEINNEGIDAEFYIESGRKYHKIIMRSHNARSVHCFVDKMTGDVYKSASWKAPAKGIRYNLLDDNSREECYARCDWAGGYLYQR